MIGVKNEIKAEVPETNMVYFGPLVAKRNPVERTLHLFCKL